MAPGALIFTGWMLVFGDARFHFQMNAFPILLCEYFVVPVSARPRESKVQRIAAG
jgi:hypothetical protein